MFELPLHFLELAKTKLKTFIPLSGRISEMKAKTYIGVKVLHAAPMTRAEYNKLRGWELPKDENAADEGYIVQYADQNETNVEGFNGYVSWSPKKVFENAYLELRRK